SFNDLFADIASTWRVIRTFAPRRIINQSPNRVADIVLAPFEIIHAVLLDVADRHDLNLWSRENSADLTNCLRPKTNTGQRNFLARRHKPGPAKHVPRHNRK